MTFNVSLIQLNGTVSSARNAIISVLTEKWPLTSKQIYSESICRWGLSISYQAVHKTIKALEQEQVLAREGMAYKLNHEWIEKAREFSERLSESYKQVRKDGGIVVLPSVYDANKFLLNYILQNTPKEGEKPFLGLHLGHFWVPLCLSIREYGRLKEAAPLFDFYALSRGNTSTDRWCSKFWGRLGVKKKTGVDCAKVSDVAICRDTVIEVFYPPAAKMELDRAYAKAKSVEDLDMPRLFGEVFRRKAEVTVAIHENRLLAEQMKERTMEYFR